MSTSFRKLKQSGSNLSRLPVSGCIYGILICLTNISWKGTDLAFHNVLEAESLPEILQRFYKTSLLSRNSRKISLMFFRQTHPLQMLFLEHIFSSNGEVNVLNRFPSLPPFHFSHLFESTPTQKGYRTHPDYPDERH